MQLRCSHCYIITAPPFSILPPPTNLKPSEEMAKDATLQTQKLKKTGDGERATGSFEVEDAEGKKYEV